MWNETNPKISYWHHPGDHGAAVKSKDTAILHSAALWESAMPCARYWDAENKSLTGAYTGELSV